jgi:hypothetical protein
MTNYTKTTDFAAKDALPSGNSAKIVKGSEIDTEFNNIATASATKANKNNAALTGTTTFETISDGTIAITAFVDEDNMASNSATLLPTQQSVKAYVDSQVTAQDLDFQADTGGALSIDLDSETFTLTGGTGIDTSGLGNAVTFAIDSTVATLTGSQTLSNKTLSAPVVSGNLTTDGLIDGRDVAVDGTKLDGIEALADVTDTANVTAAGALMDSELTNITAVKALNQGVATTDSPTFAGLTTAGLTLGATAITATGTELNYVDGVTSAIQTQLDSKAPTANPTFTGSFTSPGIDDNADAIAITIDSSERVLINTTTEGYADYADNLTIADSDNAGITIRSGATSDGSIYFSDATTGAGEYDGYIAYAHNGQYLRFGTSGTEAMRIDSSGRVLLNKTASTSSLTLESQAPSGFSIGSGFYTGSTQSTIEFKDSNTTANYKVRIGSEADDLVMFAGGSKRVTIDSSGNVGIGTTSPAGLLELSANNGTVADLSKSLKISNQSYTAGTYAGVLFQTADTLNSFVAAERVGSYAGILKFAVNAGSNANDLQERMRIDSSGRLGIGTTNPLRGIDLRTAASGFGNVFLVDTTSGTTGTGGGVIFGSDDGQGTDVSVAAIQGIKENSTAGNQQGALLFTTKNSIAQNIERMRIDSSGQLILSGNGGSATNSIDISYNGSSGQGSINADSGSGNTFLTFGTSSSGSLDEAMRIDSSGRVGIGTTNPLAPLSVKSATGNVGFNYGTSSSPERANLWYDTDGTGWKFNIGKVQSGAFTSQVTIQDNGNVGIGTSSPGGKLSIRATSFAGSDSHFGFGANNDIYLTYGSTGNTIFRTVDGSGTNSEKMRITSSGDLGLGITSTAARLHVYELANKSESDSHVRIQGAGYSGFHWLDATAYYIGQNSGVRNVRIYSGAETAGVNLSPSGTSWGTFSDERLKYDVEPIENALESLSELRTVKYRLKNVDEPDSQKKMGVVAQDLVGVLDEVIDPLQISGDDTEYMAVRYTELVPVLIKAIQEQQETITALEARITQLEN